MAYLRVPPASPLSFFYRKGVGDINYGLSIDADYEYTEAGIEAYYNCTVLQDSVNFAQPFECTDTTSFQFIYDNTGYSPLAGVYDANNTLAGYVPVTYVGSESDTGYGVYQVDIDFSDTAIFTCGNCYDVRIISSQISNTQTACWSDSGTANWVAGGSNTMSTNVNPAYVRTGVQSTLCDSPIGPVLIDRTLGYCNNMTFVANTIYKVAIYVYEVSAGTSFSNGSPYSWDILRDLTDATIIYEKKASIPTVDAVGTWHEVTTIFKTGSDTTGNIYLVIDDTPQSQSSVYLDDLTLTANPTALELNEEAVSQELSVKATQDCTVGLTYSADSNAFGCIYEATAYGTTYTPFLRIPATYHQFRMDDPSYETDENTERTSQVVISASQKIRTLRTSTMPEYLIETTALALKHPNLAVNGVDYICVTGNLAPDWDAESVTTATLEADIRLKDYDNQLSSC